jgi:hypothetical protein
MPDTRDDGSAAQLRIVVERTGGFAGLTRTWRVEPAPADRDGWRELVGRCPWDRVTETAPPTGADRFRWRVEVIDSERTRRAELGDDLDAPWRSLVEAVRTGHPAEADGDADDAGGSLSRTSD